MSDIGVPWTDEKAMAGVAEGDPAELQHCMEMHPEERKGTKEAQAMHAYATTSAEDPPTSGGQQHRHPHHQEAQK